MRGIDLLNKHRVEWNAMAVVNDVNGECPKNRFCKTKTGDPGLNYLCKGYFRFFTYMNFMKNELLNKRAPARIMQALKEGKVG